MKIVYFHDAIARLGGLERVLVDKMNYLADIYKQEVYLITTSQGIHPITFPLSKNVTHIDMNIRFHMKYQYPLAKRLYIGWKMNRWFIKKTNEIIANIDPDIIITTSYNNLNILNSLNCKCEKIIESHTAKIFTNYNLKKGNVLYRSYQKYKSYKFFNTLKEKSDIIVALTNGDAKDWDTKNVVVIPNIVDFNNCNYSSLTNKVALFAGRFTYQKGLDRMLNSWKIVCDKRRDWTLKLVGEGELKENLINQCKQLGIEDNVIFANATQDIEKEYINSSLFLFTSIYEGFGLVLVEAMQCGVPCISFDCPHGPSDIIDNGINGILVKNGDIEEFANAIIKLIDDKELRIQMGEAAIEKAKEYLPERIMPQWINLFNQLTRK